MGTSNNKWASDKGGVCVGGSSLGSPAGGSWACPTPSMLRATLFSTALLDAAGFSSLRSPHSIIHKPCPKPLILVLGRREKGTERQWIATPEERRNLCCVANHSCNF